MNSSCVPAHKQTDPAKKPGQIKNDIVVVKATPERPKDVTLGDYIERKSSAAHSMTFDEWYAENKTSATTGLIVSGMTFEEWLFSAWNAAKENL